MNYPLGLAILGFASAGQLNQEAIDGQADYRRFLKALDGPGFANGSTTCSRSTIRRPRASSTT